MLSSFNTEHYNIIKALQGIWISWVEVDHGTSMFSKEIVIQMLKITFNVKDDIYHSLLSVLI